MGFIATMFALSAAMFLFYFAVYPIQKLSLPLGADPTWYVWRADLFGSQGITHGFTGTRPAYPILSAILGTLTRTGQLRLVSVLSLVLVALLALSLGAFVGFGLGYGRRAAILGAAVAGLVIGRTPLVGENLAELLALGLVVAALILLTRSQGSVWSGPALSIGLLVAAGLAHWILLPVFLAVLVLAALFALRSSVAQLRAGDRFFRTDTGINLTVALAAVAITAALIAFVLRTPFQTIRIPQQASLFWHRFRGDTFDLALAVGTCVLVPFLFPIRRTTEQGRSAWTRAGRFINAWVVVMTLGVLYAVATLALPPERLVTLQVAVAGAVAISVGLHILVTRPPSLFTRLRRSQVFEVLAIGLALLVLAIPTAGRWYGFSSFAPKSGGIAYSIDGDGVREARMADAYLASLPRELPVVFVLSYCCDDQIARVREANVRIALSPEHQHQVFVFFGRTMDLLAGRPTSDLLAGPHTKEAKELAKQDAAVYWEQVRPVLARRPAIVVLQALAPDEFRRARDHGARQVAPGVAVVRGPVPSVTATAAGTLEGVPSLPLGLVLALLIMILVSLAGYGWAAALGPRVGDPTLTVLLAPLVGLGVLVVFGILASKIGVRMAGAGGVATYAVVVLAGIGLWALMSRRQLTSDRRSG